MDGYVGMIKLSLHPEGPAHWMLCDGRSLSPAEFPELFAKIKNKFGGDGQASFTLPHLDTGGRGHALIKVLSPPQDQGNRHENMVSQISYFASDETPEGWHECDGSLLSSARYPILARLIGTQYGGTPQQFALPLMPPLGGIRHLICIEGSDPSATSSGDED